MVPERRQHTGGVYACAFSTDGSFVVSASRDGAVNVWDPNVEDVRVTLVGHAADVLDCAVGPDDSIVSASWDGTVAIWDPTSSSPRLTLPIRKKSVRNACCAVHPQGAYFAASICGGPLEIRDLSTGDLEQVFSTPVESLRTCAVSPDGGFVAAAGDAGVIRIWDTSAGTQIATLEGHSGAVHDCAISPDGSFIVSAGEDTTLRIWDVATGGMRGVLPGHTDMVMGCAVAPDGASVLSAGFDNKLKLWNLSTLTEITEVELTGRALCVAFHHSDLVAVCGDSRGQVHRLELHGV